MADCKEAYVGPKGQALQPQGPSESAPPTLPRQQSCYNNNSNSNTNSNNSSNSNNKLIAAAGPFERAAAQTQARSPHQKLEIPSTAPQAQTQISPKKGESPKSAQTQQSNSDPASAKKSEEGQGTWHLSGNTDRNNNNNSNNNDNNNNSNSNSNKNNNSNSNSNNKESNNSNSNYSTGRRSRISGRSTTSASSTSPRPGIDIEEDDLDARLHAPRRFIARSDHEKWTSTHTSGEGHPVSKCPELLRNIRLIRAEAFLRLSLPLPRSQDLPEDLFGVPSAQDLLVAVSHAWRNQAHPDPTGHKHEAICEHLRSVIAESPGDVFVFFDFLSMPQRPFREGQRDRTASQRSQFEHALERMHLAYFVSDRIIHLESIDGAVPGEGDAYLVESERLHGAVFAELSNWIQIVGTSKSGEKNVQPSFHKEWSLFDRLLSVEGKRLNCIDEVQDIGQDGDSRTVELVRYPFGRINPIPATERGWIFLERFLTSVKCAMLDETAAAKAVLSNCMEIQAQIETCTRRLRLAAESDLAQAKEFAASSVYRDSRDSRMSSCMSSSWSCGSESTPRAVDASASCTVFTAAVSERVSSTFSLRDIDSNPRRIPSSRQSLHSDGQGQGDFLGDSPLSPCSHNSSQPVSPTHLTFSFPNFQNHHHQRRRSSRQGHRLSYSSQSCQHHLSEQQDQQQQQPQDLKVDDCQDFSLRVDIDEENRHLQQQQGGIRKSDASEKNPCEGRPSPGQSDRNLGTDAQRSHDQGLNRAGDRLVVSLDEVSVASSNREGLIQHENKDHNQQGQGEEEEETASEFLKVSTPDLDSSRQKEFLVDKLWESGRSRDRPSQIESISSRVRMELPDRNTDGMPIRMPALNTVLQGYLQELATKQFSPASTDKLMLGARNSVGSVDSSLEDQIVVGAIMESFVRHLSYHWTAEVAGQRERAAKMHKIFEVAAAWFLEWEAFSPTQFEKIRLANKKSSWWVVMLILAICLPALGVAYPFEDISRPWAEQTTFFLFFIVASAFYSFWHPCFLSSLLSVPNCFRLRAATVAYAILCGMAMGFAVWGSCVVFDTFPPPNVNATAPIASMLCLPLLFLLMPSDFRQSREIRRKFRQVIFCIISHCSIFFSVFPMLSNLLAMTANPLIQAVIILGFLLCKLMSEWLGRKLCLQLGADAMPPVTFGASFGFELQVCIAFGSGFHPLVFLLLLSIDVIENGYHLYCLYREDTQCQSALRTGRRTFIVSTLLIREFVEVLVVCTFGVYIELLQWANGGTSLILCHMRSDEIRQMRAYISIDLLVEVCIFGCTLYLLRSRGMQPLNVLKGLIIVYWKVFAASGCATMLVCWTSQHTHVGAWHRQVSSGNVCLTSS